MTLELACESIDVEGDQRINVESDREERDWKKVDQVLRSLAKQRSALDAEEARWLRAAARLKIWRELGCVSLLDYLERRLGYAPRTAHERVRVAMALGDLPSIEQALAGGMPFSAVRELTRVATRDTENAWIDACRNKSVHEIEQLVSGRERGSSPSDPARPDLTTRPLTFEQLKPTTLGLLRDARGRAQDERGHHVSDDELLALLCGSFLSGNDAEPAAAKYQVAVTICECCGQGWQTSRGRKHAMDRSEVERALCDAQRLGSLDEPIARAVQDVPPRVRRFVWCRDGGKCRVPGCRSAANIELHHLLPRALGGTHDPENLILVCDGCHAAHHRGTLTIRGTSSDLIVERTAERSTDSGANPVRAHVGTNPAQPLHAVAKHAPSTETRTPSRFDLASIRTEARAALQGLGFKRSDAALAVDQAMRSLDAAPTLESVIRLALKSSATVKPTSPSKQSLIPGSSR